MDEYNEWLRMKHKDGEAQLWSGLTIGLTVHVPHKARMEHSQCKASMGHCPRKALGSSLLRTAMLLHRSAQQQEVETNSRPTSPLTRQFKPLTRNRGNWRSGKLAAMRRL